MQNSQRYTVVRRILFPYSGAELLSRTQGIRVIATWALLFPLGMLLLGFLIGAVEQTPLLRLLPLLLLVFLSGMCMFGLLGWFVVIMNNRAVRILQARNAAKMARGGNYGS